MNIKIKEIVSRVYALLDENEELLDERVEYCDPDTALLPLIEDLLPDAARIVLCSAPFNRIDECRHLKRVRCTDGGCVALMDLPSDFLRMVWVRMDGWTGGLRETLAFGGEDYRLRCGLTTRRGRRRTSPAVAIRERGDVRQLEIFGADASGVVAEFDYLPVPRISGTTIDLPPGLVTDVCRELADMTAAVIGSVRS